MRHLLLIVLLLGAGCEDKMVRHDRPIVSKVAASDHNCTDVKSNKGIHFGGGSTRFDLNVCGVHRVYECGEFGEGQSRICRERSQASPEAQATDQALRADWDRMRLLVAKLRRERAPNRCPSAGTQAVLASMRRFLVIHGHKEPSLALVMKAFRDIGMEADMKELAK